MRLLRKRLEFIVRKQRVADDTFGEQYFEWDFTYITYIFKSKRPLPHKF